MDQPLQSGPGSYRGLPTRPSLLKSPGGHSFKSPGPPSSYPTARPSRLRLLLDRRTRHLPERRTRHLPARRTRHLPEGLALPSCDVPTAIGLPKGGPCQRGGLMRRCVCGRWARLAFLRARDRKAVVVALPKSRRALSRAPACPYLVRGMSGAGLNTPDRGGTGGWSRRGKRSLHAPRCFPRGSSQYLSAPANAPLPHSRMLAVPTLAPDDQEPSPTFGSPSPPSLKDGKLDR